MKYFMFGLCDVKKCSEPTFMGWRPLTERIGRQICKYHWTRHKNETDSFDLYEAFNFRRPASKSKRQVKAETHRCACGRELEDGHRFCIVCAAERKRQRNKRYYHSKNHQVEPIQENTLKCEQCGGPRLPNHIYCSKCAKHRKILTRRQAQSRYWRKRQNVRV